MFCVVHVVETSEGGSGGIGYWNLQYGAKVRCNLFWDLGGNRGLGEGPRTHGAPLRGLVLSMLETVFVCEIQQMPLCNSFLYSQ